MVTSWLNPYQYNWHGHDYHILSQCLPPRNYRTSVQGLKTGRLIVYSVDVRNKASLDEHTVTFGLLKRAPLSTMLNLSSLFATINLNHHLDVSMVQ